jgi:hypothetical protein
MAPPDSSDDGNGAPRNRRSHLGERGIDGSKRTFLHWFVNPMAAAMGRYKSYGNTEVVLSQNLPEQRRVLRGDGNTDAVAMLGPIAKGELVAGFFRLDRVTIGVDTLEYGFVRVPGVPPSRVRVTLTALDSTVGRARWTTTTFRVCGDGDAAEAVVAAVIERVAVEVAQRDRGQLWVTAAEAPRKASAPRDVTDGDAAARGPSVSPTGEPER